MRVLQTRFSDRLSDEDLAANASITQQVKLPIMQSCAQLRTILSVLGQANDTCMMGVQVAISRQGSYPIVTFMVDTSGIKGFKYFLSCSLTLYTDWIWSNLSYTRDLATSFRILNC
jgi:hypothetical protein